jgi:hypothetical protein
MRASVCQCWWGGGGGRWVGCTRAGVCLRAFKFTYPVCHMHVPYSLFPLWLHHIFRHYLINVTIFGKKSVNIKCVFWFPLQRLFETFLILRRNQRDIVINFKSLHIFVIFVGFSQNLNFWRQTFEKVSNVKFHQNPSSGSQVGACGQKDGQTWRR